VKEARKPCFVRWLIEFFGLVLFRKSAWADQIYVVWPYDGYRALSCVVRRRRIPALPRLKSACPLPFRVRGIPVRRPALLPPASFRRTLLYHPCHQLPFASVGLGMDFARDTCHNTGHHHLAAGPCPAHNNSINSDGKKHRSFLSLLFAAGYAGR